VSSTTASTARQAGFLQGIMLLLPITMSVMGVSLLTAVVPLMMQQFHDVPNSAYWVQLLLTMPAIWILLFSPVAGWLADTYGRRNILIWSMFLYAIVGVAPTQLNNIYAIIGTRCLVGICESIVMTITTTMIGDYFRGHTREKWLASQTAVASLSAGLVIIPIGGLLASAYGWSGPFYAYVYSVVLAFGIILFTWEPERIDHAAEAALQERGKQLYEVIPWGRVIGICAMTLVGSLMFYGIITQNANALVALGVKDPASIGRYTVLASMGVPVGTFVYYVASRLHIATLLFVEFALVGLGFFGMSRATDPVGYSMVAFVNQLGCGLVLPTMVVWATRGLSYHVRGRVTGMWTATFAIGQFISGVTIQFLSAHMAGGLMGAFRGLAIVALLTATGAILARLVIGRSHHDALGAAGS
jgi:MFS family permease